MKRGIDVALAGVAIAVLAPVMAIVALLVRVRLGAPVIFRQTRAGHHGAPFTLYKFRTMRPPRPGEDGPAYDGARLTGLGRVLRATSLDELPSLLNVLRGEMSLVGPRPLPLSYLERYTPEQARRLTVVPGLTGWAVVHGRNLLTWDERLALDCWYVDHHGVALDLKIIGKTVAMVFRRTGINHADGVTMTELPSATVPMPDADPT